MTKKRTTLLRNITEKIETDENYRDTVKFCYSDFNGNIKVRLHELHQGKYIHTIVGFNKIETLVEEITNNENRVRNIRYIFIAVNNTLLI